MTSRFLRTTSSLLAAAALFGCVSLKADEPFETISRRNSERAGTGEFDRDSSPTLRALEFPTSGTLVISLEEAVVRALNNNTQLKVQRYSPAIRRAAEDVARAEFDPVFTASASQSRSRNESDPDDASVNGSSTISGGVTQNLPTGTTLALNASSTRTDGYEPSNTDPNATSRGTLRVTQSLLRGLGTDVNLASLRQARISTLASKYELRGLATSILAQTESASFDLRLSRQRVRIFEDSLKIAEQQLSETRERIRLGKDAPSERFAAEAEVASRKQSLINARNQVEVARLNLLALITPGGESLSERSIDVLSPPRETDVEPVDLPFAHLELALRKRPEVNQARLQILSGDLDLVQTRNGLLPRLDAFMTLGRTGYADTVGRSWGSFQQEDNNDVTVGTNFEYAILNRAARAQHARAKLSREQAEDSLRNLEHTIEVDVQTAILEVQRSDQQVTATLATRRAREETFRAEVEKYRVGKSTALLVSQAQRDLLQSRLDEASAIVDSIKARIDLYRLDGTLLERRGIDAPGKEPYTVAAGNEGIPLDN